MIVAVLGDLLPLSEISTRCNIVLLGAHTELEESHMDISFGKPVKQTVGIRSRTVIKGQSDQLLLSVRRRSRHRQERHQTAKRQA